MRKASFFLFCTLIIFTTTRVIYGTVEVFKNPSLALYMTTIADATGTRSTSFVRELRMRFYLWLGANPNQPQYWGRSAFEEAVIVENINAITMLTPLVNSDVYKQGVMLACNSADDEILKLIFKLREEKDLTPETICQTK